MITRFLANVLMSLERGGNVLTDLVRESVEHENISFTDTEMEQREGFAEV